MDAREKAARQIVEKLFEDIRDRRFLKWLFPEFEGAGPILYEQSGEPLMPLDLDVQEEIKAAWAKIVVDPPPGFTILHDSENHGPTVERAATIVEECMRDGDDTPLSRRADDTFNDLYRRPMIDRHDALGKFIASVIRALSTSKEANHD